MGYGTHFGVTTGLSCVFVLLFILWATLAYYEKYYPFNLYTPPPLPSSFKPLGEYKKLTKEQTEARGKAISSLV